MACAEPSVTQGADAGRGRRMNSDAETTVMRPSSNMVVWNAAT